VTPATTAEDTPRPKEPSTGHTGVGCERDGPRPLVYRVAALGDTILLTALLRALARVWQQPCDVIVNSPWERSVLKGLDSVAEVCSIRSRRTPYWLCPSQQRLVRWLRQRGSGPTYVVDPLDKELRLLRRGGVLDEHMFVDRQQRTAPVEHHHRDFLLGFARHLPGSGVRETLPLPDPLPRPELSVFDGELMECRHWLSAMSWEGQPIVVFQTQSRRKKKGRWPIDHWVTTIRSTLDKVDESWGLLIGSAKEVRDVRRIVKRCDDTRVRSVAGQFRDLRRLFALLSLSHSCVSLDSGPAHAASTLGCPTVVLFSTGHPRLYQPIGPPELIRVVTAIPEHLWPTTQPAFAAANQLSDIEPADVLDAWARLEHRVRSPSPTG
jgi:ADP-heptose:LPS heptosyltransferase